MPDLSLLYEGILALTRGVFVQLGTLFIAIGGACLMATTLWSGARGLAFLFGIFGLILVSIGNTPLPQPKSQLTVHAEPKGSTIEIRNIKPVYKDGIELPAGDYKIRVYFDGKPAYKERTDIITLKSGEHLHVYSRLLPPLIIKKPYIDGDIVFIDKTNAALNLLKQHNLSAYARVTKHIDTIKQSSGNSGMKTRYYNGFESNPTFEVGESIWGPYCNKIRDIEYAGKIAHDAFHAKLYDTAFNKCDRDDNRKYVSTESNSIATATPNYACGYPANKVWNSCNQKIATAEIQALEYQLAVLKKIPDSKKEYDCVKLHKDIGKGEHCNPGYINPCTDGRYYQAKTDRYFLKPTYFKQNLYEVSYYDYDKGPFCRNKVKMGLCMYEKVSWIKNITLKQKDELVTWVGKFAKAACPTASQLTVDFIKPRNNVVERSEQGKI